MTPLRLAALVIERRMVALVFFQGLDLEHVATHHVPNDAEAALASLEAFLRRMLERHRFEYVALQTPRSEQSNRENDQQNLADNLLRGAGVPMAKVDPSDLLSAYGQPPLKRREHLRKAARRIWPSLDSKAMAGCVSDAAALGLFVQIERIFMSAEAEA